jgi:hypothetical protein
MATDATLPRGVLRRRFRGTLPRATLALVLVVTFATGGCVHQTLDADQLERRLSRSVSARLRVEGVEATCPDDVRVEEGGTFVCIARAPGVTTGLRIVVTQVDDDGRITWEVPGAAG